MGNSGGSGNEVVKFRIEIAFTALRPKRNKKERIFDLLYNFTLV